MTTSFACPLSMALVVSFVPLQITGNLPVPVEKSSFNLFTPNGYRIEIGAGFDPDTLKQLIGVVNAI